MTEKIIENPIHPVDIEETDLAHPPREKKMARFLFSAANWLGINWIFNSSLSLWITYNTLPTDTAQAGIRGLGKWVFRPTAIAVDKIKGLFGKSALEKLELTEREFKISENARSSAEILCMMIAGTIALFPMKWIENHKERIVGKLDSWLHPIQKHENGKIDTAKDKEHIQGMKWSDLISARILGSVGILGVNQAIQSFNNKHPESRWNTDLAQTKLGGRMFDRLSEKVRHKVIWTFSGFSDKHISVEAIQPAMQERAFRSADPALQGIVKELGELRDHVTKNPELDKLGFLKRRTRIRELRHEIKPRREALLRQIEENPTFKKTVERAIFSEQTRLFSKEVSLTLVMTGMMYAFAKTELMSSILRKCGFKKKRDCIAECLSEPISESVVSQPDSDEKTEKKRTFAGSVQNKEKLSPPTEHYTQRIAAEAEQAAQAQQAM